MQFFFPKGTKNIFLLFQKSYLNKYEIQKLQTLPIFLVFSLNLITYII